MRSAPCAALFALAALLAACSQASRHETPALDLPATWKTLPAANAANAADAAPEGWVRADQAARPLAADWWRGWQDPVLSALMEQAAAHNQTVAAAAASVRQAQALLEQQQAALWPTLGLQGSQQRSGGDARAAGGSGSLNLSASWAPDLWGRAASAASAQAAAAQASQADLAAALLAAQASLAQSYFALREADAELALLDDIIEGYERSAAIAQRRFESGTVARTDALQAQNTLESARASRAALERNRHLAENAIAALTGQPAAAFSLPPARSLHDWQRALPAIPVDVPAVAAANARIGAARAAWFPTFNLNASAGGGGATLADVISAPQLLWSLGLNLAQTLFDAGARSAAEKQAIAAHEQAAAAYRQRALTAMKEVQDQLATLQTLARQQRHAAASAENAAAIEQQMLNRYRAGLVAYTEVVTAQASALTARRSLMQLQLQRQQAVIALIQALGGGWQTPQQAP